MIKENNKVFRLETPNTVYIFRVTPHGYLENLYYGKKISETEDYSFMCDKSGAGYGTAASVTVNGATFWPDSARTECSGVGRGDFREPLAIVRNADGDMVSEFTYDGYEITDGKDIPELPCSYQKSSTLTVIMRDVKKKLRLTLFYSVFDDSDVIIKSTALTNEGETPLRIERLMSSQLDLSDEGFFLDTLDGAWAGERYINTAALPCGVFKCDSKRGISSNTHNPYVVLKNSLDYDNGTAYGFNLVYSGNHAEIAEKTPLEKIRILNGINDFGFSFFLGGGETFYAPEATLCFSDKGTNLLTQRYHDFINNHIVRGEWKNKPRPILVNNWEATYFNFTEKKLLEIARTAASLGIELFVLDDGWFGDRTDDTKGLGDWKVNTKRLPGGLGGLQKKIKALGLDFGLWVEPEMVNPDSDLYRTHPDWAVAHPDYQPLKIRNQYVLDLTNDDVCSYITKSMTEVFSSADISYVKWDFNRPLTDFYYGAESNKQGEFFHRWIKGLYKILKQLTERFPKILFESCASGGNRADLGMLCYMPQFWASDNTDLFDRMKIQEGTLTCYPQSCIGSHVSASPNHQTLRNSRIDDRFDAAVTGAFGYELDLSALNRVDRNAVKEQIKWYKQYRETLQFGDYYRIKSVFYDDGGSWFILNKDRSQGVLSVSNKIAQTLAPQQTLKTKNLDENAFYRFETRVQSINVKTFGTLINMVSPVTIKEEGKMQELLDNNYAMKSEKQSYVLKGDVLNNCGVRLARQWSGTGYDSMTRVMGDFGSRLYTIDKVEKDK